MPEFISVDEFIAETLEDYSSPTTSSFYSKMTSCRNSANNIEEYITSCEISRTQHITCSSCCPQGDDTRPSEPEPPDWPAASIPVQCD